MRQSKKSQELCCIDLNHSPLQAMFFQCSHILHRRVGKRASRQRVLKMLLADESLTQGELRKRLGIQAGSFSELAARMEKRGLIEREKDSQDRRRVVLRLTEQGRIAAGQPNEIGDEELFHALSAEERGTLQGMLQKIIDAHQAWIRGQKLREEKKP